jgi:hypothetical protein
MRYAYLTLLTLVCVLGLATSSGSVFAQAEKEVCGSVQIISGESCDPARGESRVKYLMETGINIFAIVMGIIAVFMIIIAGLTIATSGGDSSKIGKARDSIIYASVGLAVIVFARILVQFVIERVT